jgi:DNA-binding beta-propeller fold protein YncE
MVVTYLVFFAINGSLSSMSVSAQSTMAGNEVRTKYTFIEKWGSFGTGPGQFNRPHDIAFDSRGDVYVTDRDNNRVQKFTPNGTFIKAWGSKGSKDGQFSIPYSLAIDKSDNIYVADRENSRIQKFDTNGNFIAKYGTDGKGDGQFHRPEDVRIEPHTRDIYVTDTYNNRIEKFDSNGKYLSKWGTIGTSDGEFSLPQEHLWIDSKNYLYLVDGAHNPRVQIFDPNGRFLGKVGTPCLMSTGEGCKDPDGPGPLSLGDGQFSKPEHVAINSEGKMFVVDRGNHRIQVFAPVSNSTAEKSQ